MLPIRYYYSEVKVSHTFSLMLNKRHAPSNSSMHKVMVTIVPTVILFSKVESDGQHLITLVTLYQRVEYKKGQHIQCRPLCYKYGHTGAQPIRPILTR